MRTAAHLIIIIIIMIPYTERMFLSNDSLTEFIRCRSSMRIC